MYQSTLSGISNATTHGALASQVSPTQMQPSTSRPRWPYWFFRFPFYGDCASQRPRKSRYTHFSALEFCESSEPPFVNTANFHSVIAIAAARLPSLQDVEAVEDPTYLNQGVFYWSCAETSVAHVCATALTIRPLYLKLHAKFTERKKRKESASSASGTEGARTGSTSKAGNVSRSAMGLHQVECLSVSDLTP